MREQLLISVDPGLVRAARTVDGKAQFLHCARRDRASLVGNVYLGRVTRIVAPLDAAFVDCGLEREGFLNGKDAPGAHGPIAARCHEGQDVVVQVVRDPTPGKGAHLSARLALSGRLAVYRPGTRGVSVSRRIAGGTVRCRLQATARRTLGADGGGAVVRTVAASADDAELEADLARLSDTASAIDSTAARGAPPRLLRREFGTVERMLRDAPAEALIVIDEDEAFLRARAWAECWAPGLLRRLHRHSGREPLFTAKGIAEEIDGLLEPRVPLTNGGALTIERTEALHAIDVDSAGFSERASGKAALRLNLTAAQEIARQLRLRNIAGLVVIDFAGTANPEDGERIVRAVRAAASCDDATVRVAPISQFGTVELTRQRRGPSLAELLTEPCAACTGGQRKSAFAVACEIARACLAQAAATPGRRLAVHASPEAVRALEGSISTAVNAACTVDWHPDPACPRERFEVTAIHS